MFKSHFKIFLYLILQNRFAWKLLDQKEKKEILKQNNLHNNFRPDYLDIDCYQKGNNWDKSKFNFNDYRGWHKDISKVFSEKKFNSILEIGPGTGYYSSKIIDQFKISNYDFVEINLYFSSYLKKKISEIDFVVDSKIFNHDFLNFNENKRYDLIIFFSSLHHIPNRDEYFKKLYEHLNNHGSLLIIEPTHYLFRIIDLFKNYFRVYRKRESYQKEGNLATHHFISEKEINILCKDRFKISIKKYYVNSKKINFILRFINLKLIKKYFSSEIFLLLTKYES